MTHTSTHPLMVRVHLSRENGIHVQYDVVEMDTALEVATFESLMDAAAYIEDPDCEIPVGFTPEDEVLCKDHAEVRLVVRDTYMPPEASDLYALYVCKEHAEDISEDAAAHREIQVVERDWLR